jgi:uncharacterized protein
MIRLPSRLRRLDDALADPAFDDDAMLLCELDGYLAGLAVCPVPIEPLEWLPLVWGGDGVVPFEEPADVQWLRDMVVARYAEVVRDLANGRLKPVFDVDERNGEILWEPWVEGFAAARSLRPDGWSALIAGDDAEAIAALNAMTVLADVAADASDLTSIEINGICDDAARLIPKHIARLQAWRARQAGPAAPAGAKPVKVGRNDPCACGSGKKYKRCCGAT